MSDNIKAEDFNLLEENKEDWKQSKVERVNVTTEFTPALIEEHQADLEKMQRELEAQVKVCSATMQNIEKNHGFVADLEEEERHHVWMYYENEQVKKNSEAKLEQVAEQLAQYKELLETIYTKFGFVKVDDEQTDTDTEE